MNKRSVSRQPTIAIVSQNRLDTGGIEKNILQLISQLRDRFELHIIGPMEPAFLRQARDVNLYLPECFHQTKRYSKGDPKSILQLARVIRNTNADIVHTQDPRARMLAHPAARIVGAAAVHTYHMSPLFYDTPEWRKWLDLRLEGIYNKCITGRTIFVSSHVHQLYMDHGLISPDKSVVIRNGIHISFSSSPATSRIASDYRKELEVGNNEILICTVGRLTPQKGVDFFIRAIARLTYRSPALKFKAVIAGDGPIRSDLERIARKLEVTGLVQFVGRLNASEVASLLTQSDIFTLASRYECFPYTILEAMAAGLPCIVSNVGGNTEMVTHNVNGLVSNQGDVDTLAEHLELLVRDADTRKRFGNQSLQRVKHFSVENMAKATAALYDQVLLEKR